MDGPGRTPSAIGPVQTEMGRIMAAVEPREQHIGPHIGPPHIGPPHAGALYIGQPHAAPPHASQPHAGALYIGIDAEKVVVAPYPLTMRTGRARRRRAGSVTEVVPVPPSGRSRQTRVRSTCQLGLMLLMLCGVLNAAGITWWAPAAMSAALLVLFGREQARAARTGLIAVPAGDDRHVLDSPEERSAYQKALFVARRIRSTWPALEHMIDPHDADRSLTRALDDLAAIMSRRQEIRRLRAELDEVDHHDLPAGSPAVCALLEQRTRVAALWRETGVSANRILASINAAALAGDNLVREQRIGATADRAGAAIAHLAAAGRARSVEAGPELAERTAAVVCAYRELAVGR